ncbi:SH3 domain-containing protein [Streptomyces sp. NPDC001691]|uniref:SH3 domain-containing protein n=1 Tax=Streptomyces sp. NPDC001691 TaxID=3364600 RepID=UPI0036A7C6A0
MNRSTVRSGVVAVAALLALFPAAAMAAPATAAAKAPVATAHHHKVHAQGVVVTGHGRLLHIRSGAGVTYRTTGTLRSGRQVWLVCKTSGGSVHGNRVWYRLAGHHSRYVSAHYVRVSAGSSVPWC